MTVQIPNTPGGWYVFHSGRAEKYFVEYLRTQAEITEMEERALKASANRSVMKRRLVDDANYNLHKSGRTYQQMCDLRDIYARVASLSASMIGLYTTQAQMQQAAHLISPAPPGSYTG